MIIFGEHKFSILQYSLSVDLVRRIKFALVAQSSHFFEGIFDLDIKFGLLRWLFGLLVDGLDNTDVVFVKIISEHRIRVCEVVSSVLEGPVFADYLHLTQIL